MPADDPSTNNAPAEPEPADASTSRRRSLRIVSVFVRFITLTVGCYLVCVVIGLLPVNGGFEEPDDGVTIYVASSSVHADIVLPATTSAMDWRAFFNASDFGRDVSTFTHVAIGWGDRGFYLHTPQWADLRLSTAANAMLLPSDTVMHVQFTNPVEGENCRSVRISAAQYERLVQFAKDSFQQENDAFRAVDRKFSYGTRDRFYEANGSYHAFNTCNCWVGRALRKCGVKVGAFTPLPGTVLWYLPESSDRPGESSG